MSSRSQYSDRRPSSDLLGSRTEEASAFDKWLRRELSRAYDTAMHEPLPDNLLRALSIRMSPAHGEGAGRQRVN
jgi:hypothetical protein